MPLQFTTSPYSPNLLHNLLLHFRTRGWAILPDVFARDSVDPFLEQVIGAAVQTDAGLHDLPADLPHTVRPLHAPRLRSIVPMTFSVEIMRPKASVFEVSWIIKDGDQADTEPEVDRWHRDRCHEGARDRHYRYPREIHAGAYFRDMELADGPTQVISGSHTDGALSPYDADTPPDTALCRKEDMLIFDQRCWHRRLNRTKPGLRIFAIFGFCTVPVYGDQPRHMPPAQRKAWLDADNADDEIWFGGGWSRDSLGLK